MILLTRYHLDIDEQDMSMTHTTVFLEIRNEGGVICFNVIRERLESIDFHPIKRERFTEWSNSVFHIYHALVKHATNGLYGCVR
jgi:hypothetical protein